MPTRETARAGAEKRKKRPCMRPHFRVMCLVPFPLKTATGK
jgi:hypothetical protein